MTQQVPLAVLVPNNYEPKRKFRWIVEIEGIDVFLLKDAQRPVIIPRRWPLRPRVEDMRVTIYDAIEPSGTRQVMKWVNDPIRRNMEIKMLDPIGTVIEHWVFKRVKLKRADFGKLDYAAEDACTITLDMRCSTFEHRF